MSTQTVYPPKTLAPRVNISVDLKVSDTLVDHLEKESDHMHVTASRESIFGVLKMLERTSDCVNINLNSGIRDAAQTDVTSVVLDVLSYANPDLTLEDAEKITDFLKINTNLRCLKLDLSSIKSLL